MINNDIIYKFFKTLLTTEGRLTGWQFLALYFTPTFLNTGTTNETSKQFGKQGSYRHMLKSSARMYESSGSQFLRTTTSMQSRLKVFYKSRFAMIFLTILGVTEILCSFLFVLEGKASKETSKSSTLEFLEK